MTVGGLKKELEKYPDDFDVAINYEMFEFADITDVYRGDKDKNTVFIQGKY